MEGLRKIALGQSFSPLTVVPSGICPSTTSSAFPSTISPGLFSPCFIMEKRLSICVPWKALSQSGLLQYCLQFLWISFFMTTSPPYRSLMLIAPRLKSAFKSLSCRMYIWFSLAEFSRFLMSSVEAYSDGMWSNTFLISVGMPYIKSKGIMWTCPQQAAQCMGVLRSPLKSSRHPAFRKNSTTSQCPHLTARYTGGYWLIFSFRMDFLAWIFFLIPYRSAQMIISSKSVT